MRSSIASQCTSVLVLGLFLCFSLVKSARLPADVQKCHFEEQGCITKTTNYIIGRHYNGIPEASLMRLDPILVENVNIIQGPESPVNVQLSFRNLNIVGLKDTRVDSVKGFNRDFEGAIHEMRATIPHLELVGQYKISGKVIVLPITGEGNANITMTNIKALIKARTKGVVAKGATYLQVDDIKSTIDPGHLSIRLENLYKGNKQLGETTNQFLNENWQDIYKELRPSVEDTFAQVLMGVINNFFAKNKYNTLFLE